MITQSTSKTLTKNITDSTLGEIIRQIEYKIQEKGKYFYQVVEYYPSSQICSRCGSIIDRDLNASINIAFVGLTKYMKDNYS